MKSPVSSEDGNTLRVAHIRKLYIDRSFVPFFDWFNATFNNISAISWRSVLLVEETGVHEENLLVNDKYQILLY
jgi:hypothetical protein